MSLGLHQTESVNKLNFYWRLDTVQHALTLALQTGVRESGH